jgi:hypothetical protein
MATSQTTGEVENLDLVKENYYNFFEITESYIKFYNDVKYQLGLIANVFWLDTIHDNINPWVENARDLEDRIIKNTLLKYPPKSIPYKLINREEALNYSDKVVIYDASISNSSLLSLSNLIDSASTPGLSSFLSYNEQNNGINTANDIQKQFHDNSQTPKLLKTKSGDLSCMTQSDISLFLYIYDDKNNKYKQDKNHVLGKMDILYVQELNTIYTKLSTLISNGVLVSLNGVLPNDIKLINIFILNILWQKTCDYMESCGIGGVNGSSVKKRKNDEDKAKKFKDAIGFLRKFIFTDIVVKGLSYIARFGIKLKDGFGDYTMDRNIEFDVTQKACAMALDTKRRNPQSDLCKTTCVGKIFKILEKFENTGDYVDTGKRRDRNRFVFMLLKFSGDRSHLVLASMYEKPSQVCIFTGERPLTSSVLATHLDETAPNISCVSLGFKAVRDLANLGIGTAYDGIKENDHFKTYSKRTGEEKQLAYIYYNELTKADIIARIDGIQNGLNEVITESEINKCGMVYLKAQVESIGEESENYKKLLNDISNYLNSNATIKSLQEIKNKYEKLILNVRYWTEKPNKPCDWNFIWDKFQTRFVPTDRNIERLNRGNTFTELNASDINKFRNKLLDCGYKNRNYGSSYTEDTINDKVLNYLDYIHSSLDVYTFFKETTIEAKKQFYLNEDKNKQLTGQLNALKKTLEGERDTFYRLINACLKVEPKVTLEIKDTPPAQGEEYLIGDKLFNAFITQFNDSEDKKTLPKYFNNKEGTPNWKGLLLLTGICEMYRTIGEEEEEAQTEVAQTEVAQTEVAQTEVEKLDEKLGAYDIDSFLTHDQKTELAKIINPDTEDILSLDELETTPEAAEDVDLKVNVIKDAVYKFFFNLYSFFFNTNANDQMDTSSGGDIRCGQRGGDELYDLLVSLSINLYNFLNTNYNNFKKRKRKFDFTSFVVKSSTSDFEKRLVMYDIIEKLLFIIHYKSYSENDKLNSIGETNGKIFPDNSYNYIKQIIELDYNKLIKYENEIEQKQGVYYNKKQRDNDFIKKNLKPFDGVSIGGHRTHKIKRRFVKKTNKKGRQTKKAKKIRKRKSKRKNHK